MTPVSSESSCRYSTARAMDSGTLELIGAEFKLGPHGRLAPRSTERRHRCSQQIRQQTGLCIPPG
jgi:hypothetical protein